MLMRAPKESASWTWILDDPTGSGVEFALTIAARVSAVLAKHDLLALSALEWDWFQTGKGTFSVSSRLLLDARSLDDPALSERLRAFRPAHLPQVDVATITVLGTGAWFDAEGLRHTEYRLVDLFLAPGETDLWVELSVHHDVWGQCDFRGVPQPLIHGHNAPRLAAALQEIEQTLGVAAEPGEPTYYGRAEGYGLAAPDIIDGLGPDLTNATHG
ncbi:hypothetical protein [Streptomyces sp. NRRL S-378]|uniref:hypothetical protein n=1 Tax=Streptomyces sp. NRRL S-378 TaxID=1463904 RepID=UPI00099D19B3|nr:hypothetical protein [Streptomyces sp. NRRL S-378]